MRLFAALLLCPAVLYAADAIPPPPAPIQISRSAGPITIDGDLSDPGWQGAAKIDRFYEGNPGNNTEPKVKTIAYLTYDDRYFYIGIRCDDPNPSKIRAPYVERDNVIGTDDNIAVFLDTRNTKRNAMELRVNPRGIQADGFYNDANGNEDFSPDFFFDTAAKIDAGGWSAEYRIPFSSLRYPHADPQTWNILIWRNYPREFRYGIYSAPIDRNSNCLICHAHPIVGLTGLPESGHLVAAPYVTGQETELPRNGTPGEALERAPFHKDAGLDVKWTPSANNAVDFTFNPDFSQVESDIAQISVNQRFAVFYPEKRPFFLEGLDIFDTPMQVVYTRTITSPRWGVRSTGKIAGSAYTVLVTGDRGGGLTIIPGPTASFFAPQDLKSIDTIARLRHDIGKSFVGAVFTDREDRGGSGHNRVFGPDLAFRPNDTDSITAELLASSTDDPLNGARGSSYAFVSSWRRQMEKYDAGVDLNQLGDRFRADLGFIPQVGYREADAAVGYHWYLEHSMFSFIRASVFADEQQDLKGNTIFRRTSPGVGMQGVKNLFFGPVVHIAEQYRVQNKLLTATFLELQAQIDPSRRFTRISLNALAGERVDFANARVGHGATVTLTSTVRPFDRLGFDAVLSREWLNVTGGKLYTAAVERLKSTYSFSSKSIVRLIGQYVTTDRNPALYSFATGAHDGQFTGSLLYSYKVNWQTVLYIGYGDDRVLTDRDQLAPADRSLFFKVSYAMQR